MHIVWLRQVLYGETVYSNHLKASVYLQMAGDNRSSRVRVKLGIHGV